MGEKRDGVGGFTRSHFQFFLGASHSLSYGKTRNMYSIVNKRMRLSFDHGLAILIRKTNIAVNETDNSSFITLTVQLNILSWFSLCLDEIRASCLIYHLRCWKVHPDHRFY